MRRNFRCLYLQTVAEYRNTFFLVNNNYEFDKRIIFI